MRKYSRRIFQRPQSLFDGHLNGGRSLRKWPDQQFDSRRVKEVDHFQIFRRKTAQAHKSAKIFLDGLNQRYQLAHSTVRGRAVLHIELYEVRRAFLESGPGHRQDIAHFHIQFAGVGGLA